MTHRTRKPRIGPCMIAAVDYVAENPGCPILPVAEHVGPNGSRRYGYQSVHRAIDAGLLRDTATDGYRYSLEITDAGRAALASS